MRFWEVLKLLDEEKVMIRRTHFNSFAPIKNLEDVANFLKASCQEEILSHLTANWEIVPNQYCFSVDSMVEFLTKNGYEVKKK